MKTENMKLAGDLKRGNVVALLSPLKTLQAQFNAGDTFKFLGFQGALLRLSRVGDNAKLICLPEAVGYTFNTEPKPVAPAAERSTKYDAPHSDESGPSRRIVVASCLAGKHSGDVVMHLTPAEEKEYNTGMAKLAELYPD